jgi:hypothetical protein
MLNTVGLETLANFSKHRFTLFALAVRAHFDELVAAQAHFDFMQDCLGKAFISDLHHRVQGVGLGAQRPALCCCHLLVHWFPEKATLF